MVRNKKIEIEKIVQQQLQTEGRTVKWLCAQMGWDRKKWYRFQFNGYIDVHELRDISIILNHNFFKYFLITEKHADET